MGGLVDVLIGNPIHSTPNVKTRQRRRLASSSSVRWYELPDVPTLIEQVYDVQVESYAGLAAPAGTLDAVIAVLEKAFAAALQDESVQSTMKELGMEPVYMTSRE